MTAGTSAKPKQWLIMWYLQNQCKVNANLIRLQSPCQPLQWKQCMVVCILDCIHHTNAFKMPCIIRWHSPPWRHLLGLTGWWWQQAKTIAKRTAILAARHVRGMPWLSLSSGSIIPRLLAIDLSGSAMIGYGKAPDAPIYAWISWNNITEKSYNFVPATRRDLLAYGCFMAHQHTRWEDIMCAMACITCDFWMAFRPGTVNNSAWLASLT